VQLEIFIANCDRDSKFWVHRRCLVERVHPDVLAFIRGNTREGVFDFLR
jgi:hypothetical protein